MSSSGALSEELVRDNLYNWLGYGNLDGRYWVIGREEKDSISRYGNVENLKQYYELRREFEITMDFVEVWENIYGRPVQEGDPGGSTRRWQSAFILALEGESIVDTAGEPLTQKIWDFTYDDARLGRKQGNNFTGELFPLRRDSNNTIEPYRHIWDSPAAYENEVLPKRLDLYAEKLQSSDGVEYLISYAKTEDFADQLQRRFPNTFLGEWSASKRDQDSFSVYEIHVDDENPVVLIDSPFFGYGHVKAEHIQNLAKDLREIEDSR